MDQPGKRLTFVCDMCGGGTVTRDAWAKWDVKQQDWVLGAAFDDVFCHDCEGETRLVEVVLADLTQ